MENHTVSIREAIAVVAGPRLPSDTKASWLDRAARRAGVSYRQIRSLFYGEITDQKHLAFRRIIDAAAENGRREANKLAEQFETVAASLRIRDPGFYGPDVDAMLALARRLRGEDSA